MNTKLLSIYAEAARAGGFAAAARVLNLDPSAVSRAVATLEEDLGARLFQRTTRRVALTDAGARFLAKVEPILAELEEAREDLRDAEAFPSGALTVSASVAFGQACVMPHIPDFLAQYPDIDLTLRFTDRNVDLVAERIDLALRLGPQVTGDVITTKLMDTHYRICATPDYLKTAPPLAAPEDLSAQPCLCFDLPGFDRTWLFRKDGVQEVPVRPRMKVSSALALRDAALAGLGPALLADWLVDKDIKSGRLVDLFPDHAVTATTFDTAAWLIYPSRSFLPRKTRVMIDFLKDRIAGG
ncbi:LysR family transcriptional regulator [Hwanghaeella grinnelliae]|uniref:LysR family transcriptional regulator n=1 Tax=Hwanghaeella grinnelliae TaxID=2500179 RepID=A0A3S2VSZ0_9PROT|nr:LysR family transcriptional regulator [Hwanghaeella grinnelliae]RVU39119.1 LysR family transcriptional regulator [Hwanghaeella grinnelliae]